MTQTTVIERMDALETLAGYGIAAHPERCVCVRNRHASCTRCSDACTSGALSVENGELRIVPDVCAGCGTCATVCPTGALEAQHPNDAVLIAQGAAALAATGGKMVFACHRAREEFDGQFDGACVVDVVCLSRVEESLAATLFARGASEVALVHGVCESCPRREGIKSAHLVLETVKTLIAAWGMPCRMTLQGDVPRWARRERGAAPDAPCVPEPSACAISKVRAQAGGAAKPVGAATQRSKLAHVMADGTLPHFVPVRRNRLLDQLISFGEPVVDVVDTRLWGHISIDMECCASCRMCAVFCPTGAIGKFKDEDGAIGIEHYAAECVHCLLCQDICPQHAITSETAVPARQLSEGLTERYEMPEPAWHTGPDQILRRMQPQISGNKVRHSY